MEDKNKKEAGSESGRNMILLAVFSLLVGVFLLDYINGMGSLF